MHPGGWVRNGMLPRRGVSGVRELGGFPFCFLEILWQAPKVSLVG